MSPAPDRLADIFGEYANIGSLAAGNAQRQRITRKVEAFDRKNRNRPRLALDLDPLASQFIERPPVTFQGRMHRWYLLDIANKLGQHSQNLILLNIDGSSSHHLPLCITRICCHAKLENGFVGLVGIEQVSRKFGGLTKTKG